MAATPTDEEAAVPVEVAQQYVSQFLGFAPLSFIDELYNIYTDLLTECIDGFASDVHEEFGDRISERSLDAISQLLKSKASVQQDNAFDSLESFIMENVFAVQPDVVLPEDDCQVNYSSEKCSSQEEAVVNLECQIAAQHRFIDELDKETVDTTKCLTQLEGYQKTVEKMLEQQFSVTGLAELRNRVSELVSSTTKVKTEALEYLNDCSTCGRG